jgi:hypothetical protein
MRSHLLIACIAMAPNLAHAAQGQIYNQRIDGADIEALHVQSAGGQVRVHASRDEGAKIKGQRTMGDASCTLTARKLGQTLEVVVADGHGAPCRIDVDITLNAQVQTHIVSEEGNVFVSGMRRDLTLKMIRGNAVVGGAFPHLSAHLSHGSLSAQGVGSKAEITLEEGNAQIWLEAPHGRGGSTVALDVGTGNITLTVPAQDIALDVSVPQGAIRNPLNDNPEAAVRVTGQINTGSLNIKPGPMPKD